MSALAEGCFRQPTDAQDQGAGALHAPTGQGTRDLKPACLTLVCTRLGESRALMANPFLRR